MKDECHQLILFLRLFIMTASVIGLILIVPTFISSMKADIDLTEDQRNRIAILPDERR